MGEKKHIDRLFQEKFKDFEVSPKSQVWDAIQSQLEEPKRKKRIVAIPLWLKVSGIAASLLLLFTITNSLYTTNNNNTDAIIVNTETTTNKNSSQQSESVNSKNKQTISKHQDNNHTTITTSKIVATPSNAAKAKIQNKSENTLNKNTSRYQNTITKISTGITTNHSSKKSIVNHLKNNSNSGKSNKTNNTLNNSNIKTANNLAHTKKTMPFNGIQNKTDIASVYTSNEKEKSKIEKDTLSIANKVSPSIEEAIAEGKKAEEISNEQENNSNKWKVYANIAPVYYNSFGKGSHIDDQFVNNAKKGEVNASYGVTVGYAINDKITVRSGVNKLDLGYNTNDAIVYESVAVSAVPTSTTPNINTHNTNTGKTVSVLSFNNLNINQANNSFITNEITPVNLNQAMSYYEVPVEVEHRVLNKRFGINLIYGMSTFILENNEVVSQLDGVNTVIGKSNNINPVSFSTNIGLGLDYNFSKAIKVNVEPTFKYQINAFENTSGSFNPYMVGVYTGFSFTF